MSYDKKVFIHHPSTHYMLGKFVFCFLTIWAGAKVAPKSLRQPLLNFENYFFVQKTPGFTDRQNKLTFGQHNLLLAYVLSTKPIPGICFANDHCAGDLIWFNTYSWHRFCQQNLFLCIRFVHSDYTGHFLGFWHTFCQSVKPGVFQTKNTFRVLRVFFCCLLIFFHDQLFKKILSGIPSVSNSLDSDQARRFVGLIWIQNVCQGYQQITPVGKVLNLHGLHSIELRFQPAFSLTHLSQMDSTYSY